MRCHASKHRSLSNTHSLLSSSLAAQVVKLHCLAVSRDDTEGALNLILDYHEHDLAGASCFAV
jgi:hypothetical protein